MKAATELARRLKHARAKLGLSQADIAGRAGLPLDSYKKYELGVSIPGGEALASLARVGIDIGWLLTGVGDVLRERNGYVYLPLYDVRAGAGAGKVVGSENVVDILAFRDTWIRQELRARPEDLCLLYVEGDSMEPLLRSGDIVLIDRTDTEARREGIYVVRLDSSLLVKQVQRLPNRTLRFVSSNPAYQDFTLEADKLGGEVALVGRVVWACRRF